MTPPQCIQCLDPITPKTATVEHVFPQALGGMLTTRALCKSCNDYFGRTCDAWLVNHQYMQFPRRNLGLAGSSGKLPNPMPRGNVAGHSDRLVLWGNDGSLRRLPWCDEAPNGDLILGCDERDRASLPSRLDTVRQRRGPDVRILTEVAAPEQGEFEFRLKLDDSRYKLGLLKIIYELAYQVLGRQYLDDPVAGRLRTLLGTPPQDDPSRLHDSLTGSFGGLYEDPVVALHAAHPTWLVGVIHSAIEPERVHAYVRLFDKLDARFVVSEHANEYDLPPEGKGWIIDVMVPTISPITLTTLRTG